MDFLHQADFNISTPQTSNFLPPYKPWPLLLSRSNHSLKIMQVRYCLSSLISSTSSSPETLNNLHGKAWVLHFHAHISWKYTRLKGAYSYQEISQSLTFHIFVSRSTSCLPDMSIASTLKTARKQGKKMMITYDKFVHWCEHMTLASGLK